MFFSLFQTACARVQVLGSPNISNFLNGSPLSLIYLHGTKIHFYQGFSDEFTAISKQFSNIIFAEVDCERNKDVSKIVNYQSLPQLVLFRRNTILTFLEENISYDGIINTLNAITKPKSTEITSPIEYYHFTSQVGGSVVIYNPRSTSPDSPAIDAIKESGTYLPVGYITDRVVVELLGFNPGAPFVHVRKPLDGFLFNSSSISAVALESKLSRSVKIISGDHLMAHGSASKISLTIVMDMEDPVQVYNTASLLRHVRGVFGKALAYQACHFLDSKFFSFSAMPIAIISIVNPFNTSQVDTMIYPGNELTAYSVENWINKVVLGNPDSEQSDVELPFLSAMDFHDKACDITKDVIIFVASPWMPMYTEARQSFLTLANLFASVKGVSFYEYNLRTQPVMGLLMPGSEYPQVSIWPAGTPNGGSTLSGTATLTNIVTHVLPLLHTKLSPTMAKNMQKKLNDIMGISKM